MYEFRPACTLGVKLAGVHWWHKSRSHAAELTAGGAHVLLNVLQRKDAAVYAWM